MSRNARSPAAILWLQLLLVGGLASVVLIIAQTYRAASSSQAVAERALHDYAGFAVWSYREHLIVKFREAVDEVLGPVNHGEGLHTSAQRRIPDAREMGHTLHWDNACQCHRTRYGPLPQRYLGFKLGTDTLGVGVNLAPAGNMGWLADPPMGMTHEVPTARYPPNDVRWANEMLTQAARMTPRPSWGYNVMVEERDNSMRFLASRSMPTEWGDTIVYAAEYPAASIDSMLNSVLTSSDLLPPSLVVGHGNLDVFDLEVSAADGETIFRTRPAIEWEQPAEAKLPDSFGGLHLKAQLRPQVAQTLIIGGVPRSRLPLLLVLLALAVGLTALAAFQLRREVRFAAERSNFVASVSHELRTPLTQVRLVLDTLRLGRAGDAESRDTALRVADREVLRLQHLVEGVLRFSRGSRHNDSPRMRTDVAREVRAIVKEFEPLGAPRGVTVDVTGDAEAQASLQNGALRQLLLNLLDNAVKYGPENTKVLVEVHARTGGGARIAVSDSGPGVAPGDRERIWRPFERGSLARSRAVGGSGIGLTIVREIAEEHGGRAWVEDAAGGGARFVVDLPDETV